MGVDEIAIFLASLILIGKFIIKIDVICVTTSIPANIGAGDRASRILS